MAPRAESVRSDNRYPHRTGQSYYQHVPRDTTLKFFPADLDPAYKSLRRKMREVKNKIELNFPKRRSSLDDDLEHNSPVNLADSFEEKREKVVKKDLKNSSMVSDLFNASFISQASENKRKNAFRNMKRILHSRGNDVTHAKYHKTYVSGIIEDGHESKANLTLDEPLLAFYSPYTNTVERSTKIPDYKELVRNARDKSVAKVTKYWTEKIIKQKEFITSKVNTITEYIENETRVSFAKENPEQVPAVPAEEDKDRPKSQLKQKKRPVSQFSGNASRSGSPIKSRQSSMDSLKGSPKNSSSHADGQKTASNNTVSAKVREKDEKSMMMDSFVKEESVDGELPSLSNSFMNRLSHGNSTTSMMHQRNNHRKKKSNGNYSYTEPGNRAGKDGRAQSTRIVDDKSRDRSYTEINKGMTGRLTPAEYDENLNFSKNLFAKEAKKAARKLNHFMNKYTTVKNKIDTSLSEKLRKMNIDRHELLLDKRKVVIKDEKMSNLNTRNGPIMRKKFELSLQDRKAQNRKQIKICEDVVEYLKKLPFSVPMERFSFMDYLRGILEKGDFINKEQFLYAIDNLDPSSPAWKYQEPVVLMFKDDTHINFSNYEYEKWRERQAMGHTDKRKLPLIFK